MTVQSQSKVCECGCGKPTPVATHTRARWGYRKGEQVRFIRGHYGRLSVPNLSNFLVNETSGCWEWQGAKNDKGYGQVRWEDRTQYAHRLMYIACFGPLPDDLDVDHLCRNHGCLNPYHLEAVTRNSNKDYESLHIVQ